MFPADVFHVSGYTGNIAQVSGGKIAKKVVTSSVEYRSVRTHAQTSVGGSNISSDVRIHRKLRVDSGDVSSRCGRTTSVETCVRLQVGVCAGDVAKYPTIITHYFTSASESIVRAIFSVIVGRIWLAGYQLDHTVLGGVRGGEWSLTFIGYKVKVGGGEKKRNFQSVWDGVKFGAKILCAILLKNVVQNRPFYTTVYYEFLSIRLALFIPAFSVDPPSCAYIGWISVFSSFALSLGMGGDFSLFFIPFEPLPFNMTTLHHVLLSVRVIRKSTDYANGLGMGKVEYRGSEPAFAWWERGKPLSNPTSSSPEQDSSLNLPVLGSLAQHETSALANYATEADLKGVRWLGHARKEYYILAMMSYFVSQIVAGSSQNWKLPLITVLYNEPNMGGTLKRRRRCKDEKRVTCGLGRSQTLSRNQVTTRQIQE
uniref:Uncharacterized protein n=1 Tax=Timema bartmani TaxID=61472 RepID=A0A7R9EQR8_9NEOP|nr:unnamed protein product [Timema bartmani]